ncbi:probable disease resistance protein At5g43730 [Gossypium hirsutum]|uniref:Probable disease resistance protein At5g43730 n=1 Tax=Gossypium hirsutum TaxID=3635 RepID=A0ABM2YVH9_GOSHI|nr:probable disease resistance protein At5g43730 [Gossypium hirsutum]
MATSTRQRQNHKCVWENQETIVMHSSLKEKVEELLGWLKDSRSKRICIMGPAGIGKTTLMKTVRDIVKKSCDFGFDHIFYLSATETTESKQKKIWDLLGKGRNEDTHHQERETVISEELRTKKYLLFLDDVLSEVNLKEVGIHSDHEHGRIVFACRDKYTGHTDIDMTLKPLSPEDATMLFWKAVGSERKKGRDAEVIIGLCGGMPPILNLIGRCLRGKDDPKRWRDVKRQLQCPNMQGWEEFGEYYNFLKIVYEGLPTDEYKHCLLYWAIFPLGEKINRDHIIECWATEQFLEPERLCEARDRGHTILDDFVDKFLLQKGETSEHFKMFLWFQKAPLMIANKENGERVFVENGKSINELEWIHGNRVLFARTDLSLLPEKPECRGMVTLLLHENDTSRLQEQLFSSMRDLKLLGLQETKSEDFLHP